MFDSEPSLFGIVRNTQIRHRPTVSPKERSMVQYGGPATAGGNNAGQNRHLRNARSRLRRLGPRNVLLLLLLLVFVLRNLLRSTDDYYRGEEIQFLRDSGMSEEEIDRYVVRPRGAVGQQQQQQQQQQQLDELRKEVAFLASEIKELRADQNEREQEGERAAPPAAVLPGTQNEASDSGRGAGLDAALAPMDRMHEEKRRRHEAQLLRDHPGFKPGKRLRDLRPVEAAPGQ